MGATSVYHSLGYVHILNEYSLMAYRPSLVHYQLQEAYKKRIHT